MVSFSLQQQFERYFSWLDGSWQNNPDNIFIILLDLIQKKLRSFLDSSATFYYI